MKRANTKIGDVFSVVLRSNKKGYFQLIAFDSTQMNSDVIRVFKDTYPISATPTLPEVISSEVEFYAHCVTKFGLSLKLWEKIGNSAEIGDTKSILFRDTNDYGLKIGEQPIKISKRWYVWELNQDFKNVGLLSGQNRKAEIGIIVNPYDIIDRMETGKYNFMYPDFE